MAFKTGITSNEALKVEPLERLCDTSGSFFSSHHLLLHKFRHSQKVVGGAGKPSRQLSPVSAFEPGLPEPAGGLHPAEDLLNPLTDTLADGVARMPGGAAVDGGTAFPCSISSHMRSHLSTPERLISASAAPPSRGTVHRWPPTFAGLAL